MWAWIGIFKAAGPHSPWDACFIDNTGRAPVSRLTHRWVYRRGVGQCAMPQWYVRRGWASVTGKRAGDVDDVARTPPSSRHRFTGVLYWRVTASPRPVLVHCPSIAGGLQVRGDGQQGWQREMRGRVTLGTLCLWHGAAVRAYDMHRVLNIL